MGGESGGDGVHVYVWLSLLFTETITLLIGYTLMKTKKLKKKKLAGTN